MAIYINDHPILLRGARIERQSSNSLNSSSREDFYLEHSDSRAKAIKKDFYNMTDFSMFDISQKKALVTGGAVGIGRASAIALAKGGADVAIVGLSEVEGLKTVALIESMGVKSFFVQCDIAEKKQVHDMVAAVVDRFGSLDIAINNAGIGLPEGRSESLVKEDWDKVISINLTGTMLCTQLQAQHMIKQRTGGKIINIGSVSSFMASGHCAYNASKAGVVHLTRSLASEWGRFNINVNCVSPSWIMTNPMSSTPADVRAKMRGVIPLGHLQRTDEMQGAILYLASSASNYVTGQNLVVDGGKTLNIWLDPLERSEPPRVSPEEEVAEIKQDLDDWGVAYDKDGVRLD